MPNVINVVLSGNVSPLTAALAQGAAQLNAFSGRAAQLGAQARQAAAQANQLGSQAQAAANRVVQLGARADEAAAAATRLRDQAAQGGAGAAALARQADAAAAQAARLRAQAASAGEAAGRLGEEADRAAGRAGRLGAEAEQAAQRAQRMHTAMTVVAAAGALVAAGLAAAVAAAVDFESRMHAVASIDQTVQANFAAMSQAVLNLSKEVPQSAAVLADGLYNIAGSGFQGAEALHILEISATAASAGMTTTDNAAKAIVASLNAYGLSAEDAGRVSDALFNTVNYGVLSYEELTAAVAHFIGNSAAAGVSIEEAGAALATMTLSGLSAAEAGVSLNNMLSKLIKPSEALGAAAQDLGINFERDLKNPAIGLHGVMLQLMEASGGNLKVLLEWFPEIRAARGALALMSAEGENYRRVFQGMGSETANAGATQAAFAEVAKSTAHQLAELKNQVMATAIELGLKFLPYINDVLAGLGSFGGKLKEVAGEVAGALGPGFAALAEAARNVIEVFDDLHVDELVGLAAKIGIGALVAGFNALAAVLSGVTGFVADHTVAVEAMVAAWLFFNSAAIAHNIRLLAVTIASGLVDALAAGIRAVDAMVVSLTALGGGALWRGLLIGTVSLAAVTAGIALVVTELGRMKQAKEDIKAVQLKIEDILGSTPGRAAAAIREMGSEFEQLGTKAERSFAQADAELKKMAEDAQKSLQAVKKEADANFWDAEFWNDAWKVWERPGQEAKKFEQILRDVGAAQEENSANWKLLSTNLKELSEEFGISEQAVARLAEKYGVNLVQALDVAGQGGVTLREAFASLANELTGAGASQEEVSAALEALDLAAGGAEQAVQELNMQLGFLAGTGINAQLAIDQVKLALLDLAENGKLAEGGLTGFGKAAIENRDTVLSLVQQIIQAAEAQTKLTGSTEAGIEVYNRLTGELKGVLLQAGLTEEEINGLFESVSQANAIGGINVPVTTPGLSEAAAAAAAYGLTLDNIKPDVGTLFSTPGLPESEGGTRNYTAALEAVKLEIQTMFATPGLDISDTDTRAYSDALAAVERAIETIYTTPGLLDGTASAEEYSAVQRDVERAIETMFATPGLEDAVAGVAELTRWINGIDRDVWIRLTVEERRFIKDMFPNGPPPGMATGGMISGPGGPTSDHVLIAASAGEWVINARAARMYGPAAMASVNAGRAVVIPRFAVGGPIARATTTTGRAGESGADGGTDGADRAIQMVARGTGTLAEAYQAAASSVTGASAALRGIIPRMWAAERRASALGTSTGAVDWQTARWAGTLATATDAATLTTGASTLLTEAVVGNTLATEGNVTGLVLLGTQMAGMVAEQYPATLLSTQTQTLAQGENTLGNTENLTGLQLLGTQMDLMVTDQYPLVLLGTQTQTLAQQENTLANDENLLGLTELGVQMDLASGVQLPTLTLATDTQTVATQLHTTATVEQTAALDETTAASTEVTAAFGEQTAAAGTATAANATLTGSLDTVSAAAAAAAASVQSYVAALDSIPPSKETVITTTYVTVGAPAAAAAPLASGGMITGPGGPTSDSVLAALSPGEWVIRAAAAARQGPYRMAALNAGRADVVPRYAAGGMVPGFASGGAIMPANPRPVGVVVNNHMVFETSVTVNGGASAADGAMVRAEVEAALSGVARRIRAGAGMR